MSQRSVITTRRILVLALLTTSIFTFGCDRLPSKVVQNVERIHAVMESLPKVVDKREAEYQTMMRDASLAYLIPYSERERWPDHFQNARKELDRTRALYRDEVAPLLDENRSEDAEKVVKATERVNVAMQQVGVESASPKRRAETLIDVKRNGPERIASAEAGVGRSRDTVAALEPEVARSSDDYPEKREDLSGRIAALAFAAKEAEEALASARRASEASEPDLANIADSLAASTNPVLAVDAGAKGLREKMAELHKSYSKTLIDMKVTNTVQVGRTSWNEYVDFGRETDHLYAAREVDEAVLDELEAMGERPIFSRGRYQVSDAAVLALQVDLNERLPRGDNAAEVWVADTGVRYFHRYSLEENGAVRELDWEEVDEETFERYEEDLGMEILSKPFGMYEDEVLTFAAPPGLSKVGNPAYGRWEDDGQGRRRWSFFESYLFYHMMFGGRRHYYYYNDCYYL